MEKKELEEVTVNSSYTTCLCDTCNYYNHAEGFCSAWIVDPSVCEQP